ncbi:hypothetical protein Ndes2526B_g03909 [Nannochloris sp. 'desiccata']|nr:hypothetical protein KSW81_005228 [Chlorella desiccata (nom. nud.)]KAH7621573.1 putative AB hydrolase superfamily protein YdjP [Chlorella desiccata (nom. nud.)]
MENGTNSRSASLAGSSLPPSPHNGTTIPASTPTAAASTPRVDVPPVGNITTNDGVTLHYERFGSHGPVVCLIHGWSGSRHYWDLNTRIIARTCQVITYDLRHHGESDKPAVGFHVARLAADLHNLLRGLNLENVTVVGASMGAAIIWSYFELFAGDRISQAVFVDQAPLQNIAIDWKAGSTGCYDTASLTRLQCRLLTDFKGFAKDNALFCAGPGIAPDAMKVLENETLRANPVALAALMADHTALDWRPVLQQIKIPCINIIGRRSAVFPWWGVEEVGRLVPGCKNFFFEEENHWMYLQQPSKFSALVAAFATDGTVGAEKAWTHLHPSISEIVH